ALGVDVGIDEGGGDDASLDVDDLTCLRVATDAGDVSGVDGNVRLQDLSGEDVQDLAAPEHAFGRVLALGDGDAASPLPLPHIVPCLLRRQVLRHVISRVQSWQRSPYCRTSPL